MYCTYPAPWKTGDSSVVVVRRRHPVQVLVDGPYNHHPAAGALGRHRHRHRPLVLRSSSSSDDDDSAARSLRPPRLLCRRRPTATRGRRGLPEPGVAAGLRLRRVPPRGRLGRRGARVRRRRLVRGGRRRRRGGVVVPLPERRHVPPPRLLHDLAEADRRQRGGSW